MTNGISIGPAKTTGATFSRHRPDWRRAFGSVIESGFPPDAHKPLCFRISVRFCRALHFDATHGYTSRQAGVCVTIPGGIRQAVHPSLSKSRRLLGERQESADKHAAQETSTMRKRVSFQAHSLARRACIGDKRLSAARLTPSESQLPVRSIPPRIELHTRQAADSALFSRPPTLNHPVLRRLARNESVAVQRGCAGSEVKTDVGSASEVLRWHTVDYAVDGDDSQETRERPCGMLGTPNAGAHPLRQFHKALRGHISWVAHSRSRLQNDFAD